MGCIGAGIQNKNPCTCIPSVVERTLKNFERLIDKSLINQSEIILRFLWRNPRTHLIHFPQSATPTRRLSHGDWGFRKVALLTVYGSTKSSHVKRLHCEETLTQQIFAKKECVATLEWPHKV